MNEQSHEERPIDRMIRTYCSSTGKESQPGQTVDIEVFVAPNQEERQRLVTEYGIDEHDVAAALDADEVSRLEFYDDAVLIFWKRPKHARTVDGTVTFEVDALGILVRPNSLVFIQSEDVPLIDDRKQRHYDSTNEFLIRFLYATVSHFQAHLKGIRQVSRELEVKLNKSMENKFFLQMFAFTESLVYYIDALEANSGLLTKLQAAGSKLRLTESELTFLDDVIIDNRQCQRQAEINSSVMTGLMDARGNIINNNMNVFLKNLTLINVVFLPLNLIASVGGMSEYSVLTEGLHPIVSYSIFSIAMVLIGALTWYLLNRSVLRSGID